MKTINIQIPEGYEIDSLNKETGVLSFREVKPKNITDRIKTVGDAVKYLDALGHEDSHNDIITLNYVRNRFGLSDHLISYQELVVVTRALNEGWTPDWNDYGQPKYYPYFKMGGSAGFRFHDCDHWYSRSDVGSRLCFKSSELAEYAGTQFIGIYKRFMK